MGRKTNSEAGRVVSIVAWGVFSILVIAFLAFFILMSVLRLF